MKVAEIWRYPVKSLTGSPVERTVLNPGQGLPFDRRWALALPGTDAARGEAWHPKNQFAVLVKEYGLARLRFTFDDMTGGYTLTGPDGLNVEGNLLAPEGRAAMAQAVGRHLGLGDGECPQLVEASEIGYFDSLKGPVSLLNLASVRDLEQALGQRIEPERFRMNLWIEDCPAWAENDWVGKTVQVGPAHLTITKPTGRCKATHVNPLTGEADMKVMHSLKAHFGHTNMGVYAMVDDGGPVSKGDAITVLDS